jgi:Sap, sulfolipid-1-addressing protein
MYGEAAGFAFLAALTPTAILVAVAYLGSASPRRTMSVFLAGAITVTTVVAVIALVALRAGGLSLPGHHTPRYGLRIGLGLLAVAAGVLLARRRPGRKDQGKARRPGLMTRLMNRPGPVAAFVMGVLVFSPSAQFLAAVQVIATARASPEGTAGALVLVVLIDVMFVWLPLALYLARPEATHRTLKAFNAWLRAHGRVLVSAAVLAVGLILIADGIAGLA